MKVRNTADAVKLLEHAGELIRINEEIDPNLEAAEIQRQVFAVRGPAILFTNLKGCAFPAVANMFGTRKRAELLLGSRLHDVQALVQMKANPAIALRRVVLSLRAARALLHALPLPVFFRRSAAWREIRISDLPQIKSWPKDGGAFITLPQVYTEDPNRPGIMTSNLGMYRVQLAGNLYQKDREVGLHYQIHRGIGVHHTAAAEKGKPLPVSIFIGGHPAHSLAAVMPLPEGLPEVAFAGALAGRNFRYYYEEQHLVSADADFVILGEIIDGETKPEGPFGDHLGYYSLKHDFPVMRVQKVYARKNAIWPFTVVGRPPQEDTIFGELIHDIAAPMVPASLPGVRAVHAVDAAGVHPLLLAIGSERYTPFMQEKRPQEILTQANAILGFNQMSLAKYLFIIAGEDVPGLDIHDIPDFFMQLLQRVDFRRDMHFQTQTTIDTLDYSGTGLNSGSKLVLAAAGPPRRELTGSLPRGLKLPEEFSRPCMAMPGVLVVQGSPFISYARAQYELHQLDRRLEGQKALRGIAMIIIADNPEFVAAETNNFLWVTFTRSNPSHDVHGIGSFIENKHYGCRGPMVIDARTKPHHAPPLEEDPAVLRRVKKLAERGGPLFGIL